MLRGHSTILVMDPNIVYVNVLPETLFEINNICSTSQNLKKMHLISISIHYILQVQISYNHTTQHRNTNTLLSRHLTDTVQSLGVSRHEGKLLAVAAVTSARCDVERHYRPSLSHGENLCAGAVTGVSVRREGECISGTGWIEGWKRVTPEATCCQDAAAWPTL